MYQTNDYDSYIDEELGFSLGGIVSGISNVVSDPIGAVTDPVGTVESIAGPIVQEVASTVGGAVGGKAGALLGQKIGGTLMSGATGIAKLGLAPTALMGGITAKQASALAPTASAIARSLQSSAGRLAAGAAGIASGARPRAPMRGMMAAAQKVATPGCPEPHLAAMALKGELGTKLGDMEGMLKQAADQRLATSEHNTIVARDAFRKATRRQLAELVQCCGGDPRTIRVVMS